jgi:hypothetical protein
MLPRILDFLANQAIEAFDLGGSIDHPGEKRPGTGGCHP